MLRVGGCLSDSVGSRVSARRSQSSEVLGQSTVSHSLGAAPRAISLSLESLAHGDRYRWSCANNKHTLYTLSHTASNTTNTIYTRAREGRLTKRPNTRNTRQHNGTQNDYVP